jgi:shikimate dehydrogenase
VNRSAARGEAMVGDLRRNSLAKVTLLPWTGTFAVPAGVDLLVNATSIGLFPNVDAMPDVDLSAASERMLVCDAVFNPPETRLLRAARECGLPVLDGLSMLVYQGVIGYEIWTGQTAPEGVMKDALRSALLGDSVAV